MPMVVFVCEHGSAKSVIAAAHFNQLAQERHLSLRAVGRGMDPDASIPQHVIDGLRSDGLYPNADKPQRLSPGDLRQAIYTVSFCDMPDAYNVGAPVERWSDVPPVSQGYDSARAVIAERVSALVDLLSRGRKG